MELTSPKVIKDISRRFDFSFRKGYGQNFLLDKSVLELSAEAAEPKDGVIEIGPGFGVLTKELAKRSDKVVSIELDERLIPVLEYTLADFDNIKILNQDFLKTDLSKLIDEEFAGKKISIAANLPYYITTPILIKILESRLPLKNVVVMVQKEVAERICSKPGKKTYGSLSVLCQYYADAQIIATVKATSFMPPPGVDSALIKLEIYDKPRVSVEDEELFFKTVNTAFNHRRKTLENCLSQGFTLEKQKIAGLFSQLNIPQGIRGERLSLEEFAALANELQYIVKMSPEKLKERSDQLQKNEECKSEDSDVKNKYSALMDSVGFRIYFYRNRAGYSRNKLAELTGISESAIKRYEKNETKPTDKKLEKIVQGLNMSIEDFLKEDAVKENNLPCLFADGIHIEDTVVEEVLRNYYKEMLGE